MSRHLKPQKQRIIAIPLDLPEGHAIKFIAHRGYDKMLCNHVYHNFCPDCPQYECKERTRPPLSQRRRKV